MALAFAAPASANPGRGDMTCHDAELALVNAQAVIGDVKHNGTAHDLYVAQQNDAKAQADRDAAIAAANKQYDADVKNAVADDPKTKDVDEHAVAIQAAATKRDKAIADANKAYRDGGTAKRLHEAELADKHARGIVAQITVVIGRVCAPRPAPEPVPAPEPAPAPAPEPAPAPAPAPATGGDNNTQVNVVVPPAPSQSSDSTSQIGTAPESSAETGDGSYAAR
jgi:hypothetical protein